MLIYTLFLLIIAMLAAFWVGRNHGLSQSNALLKSRLKLSLLGLILIILAAVLLVVVPDRLNGNKMNISNSTRAVPTKKTPLYWLDPMEPNVHYPKGGTSPMGMTLEPVYSKNNPQDLPSNAIKLPDSYINNLGVKLSQVTSSAQGDNFSAYGTIESNEAKISYVSSYANGWVRNLAAKTTQMPVRAGQLLLQLYSPTIINAENEYLSALQSKNQLVIAAAKSKLLSLHVDARQINEIATSGVASQLINIYAPQSGILSAVNIREGDYITPDTKLFTIVDLSSLWLIANVFEKQAKLIKIGTSVNATISGHGARQWSGKVEYIYPELDAATRTVRVRISLANPDLSLKPNMYANVSFMTGAKAASLLVPTQAIILSSSAARVIVALGEGVFQVRQITIGNEIGDVTQVLSGLALGEEVVSSGEFMLDSEASLNAGLARINSSAPAAAAKKASASAAKNSSSPHATHEMDDMDMSGMDMSR